MSFHIALPSDANQTLCPENKANEFKVKLQRSINLGDRPWEVAATDIIVPAKIISASSSDRDMWFRVKNGVVVGTKYHMPDMHHYRTREEFMEKLSSMLETAVADAKRKKTITEQDDIKFHYDDDRMRFTVLTALTDAVRQSSVDASDIYQSVELSKELTNLFGLKGQLDVMGRKHHKNWLRDTTAPGQIAPPPNYLWFLFNGGEKIYLPDLYTYATSDGVCDKFKAELTKAVKKYKAAKTLNPYDDCTVERRGDKMIITIRTQLNKLPGHVQDKKHLNALELSPFLASLLGASMKGFKIINHNYYARYREEEYDNAKFLGDDDFDASPYCDSIDEFTYRGRLEIFMKPGGTSQSKPADITYRSHNTTTITTPYKPLGEKCLSVYGKNIKPDTLPSGVVVTGNINAARSWTWYSLTSTVNIKVGHEQLSFYSNIVEPHYVGSGTSNLLRTVTHKRKRNDANELKEINVTTPYYVPLKSGLRELRDIEVVVKDEHNHLMPFGDGKTLLDLHFRPAKRRKTSQFTITVTCRGDEAMRLNKPIDLSGNSDMAGGQWEVALLDIRYPFLWKNVLDQVKVNDEQLPSANYTTETFLTALDTLLRKHGARLDKTRQKYKKPVAVIVRNGSVKLSQALAQILGLVADRDIRLTSKRGDMELDFKPIELDPSLKDIEGPGGKNLTAMYMRRRQVWTTRFQFPRDVDLSRGFRLFWVYAQQLIEAVNVGHVKAELLRKFIPQRSDVKGGIVHHEFITPHYHPLKQGVTYLNEIKVEVMDEMARHVQFIGQAPPTATLHFQLQ